MTKNNSPSRSDRVAYRRFSDDVQAAVLKIEPSTIVPQGTKVGHLRPHRWIHIDSQH